MAKLPDKRDPKTPTDRQTGMAQEKKKSQEVIYRTMMKGGGEPFGHPFEAGLSTLTEKIVKLFQQAGFFGFETMEKLRKKNERNKFSRHGASPFFGNYRKQRTDLEKPKKR